MVYVLTIARTDVGINKAESSGKMDAHIEFADALRRVLLTALASHLAFHSWICRETLCDGSSVTSDLRQCDTGANRGQALRDSRGGGPVGDDAGPWEWRASYTAVPQLHISGLERR